MERIFKKGNLLDHIIGFIIMKYEMFLVREIDKHNLGILFDNSIEVSMKLDEKIYKLEEEVFNLEEENFNLKMEKTDLESEICSLKINNRYLSESLKHVNNSSREWSKDYFVSKGICTEEEFDNMYPI